MGLFVPLELTDALFVPKLLITAAGANELEKISKNILAVGVKIFASLSDGGEQCPRRLVLSQCI